MSGVRSKAKDDFNDSTTDGTSSLEAVGFTACNTRIKIGTNDQERPRLDFGWAEV